MAMTHEELIAKRRRYRKTPFDVRANAESIKATGRDLWGQKAVLINGQPRPNRYNPRGVTPMAITSAERRRIHQEQVEYNALCKQAERLGIATSLDDPRSPRTVVDLRAAVERAS